jgi:hypothetical protein
VEGIKARLDRVKEILEQGDDLEAAYMGQAEMVRWYRENHVRYCRP